MVFQTGVVSALLVSDVIFMAIISVLEGVPSHSCVGFHVPTPCLSDCGLVHHTFCQALPLGRALARATLDLYTQIYMLIAKTYSLAPKILLLF